VKIKLESLAQYKHVKLLMASERQALIAYRFAMNKLMADLRKLFKKNKLAKSDDTPKDGLESGWTGEVPQLEVDLSALASKTINKYLDGLRWVLMGDFAGKEASKAAESIGLKGRVTPGIIQAAYLHSLDAHSQHYEAVTGDSSPEMPEDLLRASMDQINKRVQRFVEQNLSQLKLDLSEAVNRSVAEHNFKMLNSAHKEAHELLSEVGSVDAATEAGDAVNEMLRIKDVLAEVSAATNKFENKWDMAVKGDLAIASAAGTHQAMLEIHGRDNKDVRIIWMMLEDERVCSFCSSASRKPDGSFKYYKVSDFEPSGYNYGKKKTDWKLCIPPAHPRCRCALVYVPKGFSVDDNGSLISG
jgi:hypothetical protein